MVLAVDIGNTNIVMGVYNENEMLFSTRIATDRFLEPDQYALQIIGVLSLNNVSRNSIKASIISSVVPQITNYVAHAINKLFNIECIILKNAEKTGLTVKIDNAAELGNDLIAGVLGAKYAYTLPAIVIDLGTATKITAVNTKGEILGCSITPGVFISLNALIKTASALGGIDINAPSNLKAIGTNTQNSMKSGVVFGTACMLDGMIERFENEMQTKACVLATGGAAGLIVSHCKTEIIHAPNLIIDGLYGLYKSEFNNG